MKQIAEISFAALIASTLLAACGGGGNGGGSDSAATSGAQQTAANNSPVPVATTDCPASYNFIILNQSSLKNATLSTSVGDATLSFKTPAATTPSVKVCLGATTDMALPGGVYPISQTYDIQVIPLDAKSAGLADLVAPTLTVKFTFNGVPPGLSFDPAKSTVSAYYDDRGTLQTAAVSPARPPSLSPNAGPGDPRLTTGEYAFLITQPNKYVVGVKP
jgi:hypothetical protein